MPNARWRPHTDRLGNAKVRYDTEQAALEVVRTLRDEDLDNGTAFRRWPTLYRCSDPDCAGWHVGNWSDRAFRSRPTTPNA